MHACLTAPVGCLCLINSQQQIGMVVCACCVEFAL